MSALKPCHFRPVLFCVLYTRVHVPVIQQQHVPHEYKYELVHIILDVSVLQQNPENVG